MIRRTFTRTIHLSKPKIHQHSSLPLNIIQKISSNVNGASHARTDCLRWLYVSMYDTLFVHSGKGLEQ